MIRSEAWSVKAISYIYHFHAVQKLPWQFFTERHDKSWKFPIQYFVIGQDCYFYCCYYRNVFQRCAITHHNLADSLAVIDGEGGIVWANFGQLTKVDTAREMWIIRRNKLQKLISQNCELVTKFRGLLTNGLLLFTSFVHIWVVVHRREFCPF